MQVTPIELRPIGVIRTQYSKSNGTPIQAAMSDSVGTIELHPEFVDGLSTLETFSHLILLYWFHKAQPPKMQVRPYLDQKPHGVFATRAPARPNPIGLSIVELLEIDGGTIRFRGADMLDWTPLLDIKPFVPKFDGVSDASSGWLADFLQDRSQVIADDRFEG